jgi:hypothetical protein
MPEAWSPEEVAATVADYFVMLEHEFRGEPFNKSEHNRRLQAILSNRSEGAIEFKHCNISAILIEIGFPYVDGYKPRGNYQELLKDEVSVYLDLHADIVAFAQAIVDAPVVDFSEPLSIDDIFVPAPSRDRTHATYEKRESSFPILRNVNYLEREARNSSLGLAGEKFVLDVEHRRLWELGLRSLAERIEHVAKTQGDGLGYDIVSYDEDGRERLIEVKTTAFGSMTPFFASAKEVSVSDTREGFHLYRVFKFRETPRIFSLPGPLRESCTLDAVQFRVKPGSEYNSSAKP